MVNPHMLGIFDSGSGGLTILREIHKVLPEFSTSYVADRARMPYGPRDRETIYQWTIEGVRFLFDQGCPLVVLACNTAAAAALRRIQQEWLPQEFPDRRVLGIIRPTVEVVARETRNGHLGVVATSATVASRAYTTELAHYAPGVVVTEVAAPSLAEHIEGGAPTVADVQRAADELMRRDPLIDCVLLGCTHYSVVSDEFRRALPASTTLVSQGGIVAPKLKDYLARHTELSSRLDQSGLRRYHTTE